MTAAGSNTLRRPDTFASWLPILQNFGVLITDVIPLGLVYQNVQHLRGGAGDDWFWFASDFAVMDGVLNGGAGVNDLNYFGYTVPVSVNLALGSASGVAGGLSNIRNVAGGPGNDVLVDDDQSNVLAGGDGSDVLIGGGRGLTRQPDILLGGGGEDILSAGFTDHDLNSAALDAARAEWTRADRDYATRVNNLRTGAGGSAVRRARRGRRPGVVESATAGGAGGLSPGTGAVRRGLAKGAAADVAPAGRAGRSPCRDRPPGRSPLREGTRLRGAHST